MGPRSFLFLVLVTGIPAFAQDAQTRANSLPTLTRIAQIRHLPPGEAVRHYPVHIRAVATYYNPRNNTGTAEVGAYGPDLFVQDSSAGIWIDITDHPLDESLRAGQLIEIDGVTAEPDFAPQIEKAHWRIIGEAALPVPHEPSFERMASTAEDSQWVKASGIVRSASVADHLLVLSVALPGGHSLPPSLAV